jgi:hypothetical protein
MLSIVECIQRMVSAVEPNGRGWGRKFFQKRALWTEKDNRIGREKI